MEIRPTILQQISQAIAPAVQSSTGIEPGGAAVDAGGEQSEAVPAKPVEIPNLRVAINSGDASLVLSPKEKEILQVLFENQTESSATSGFRLYSGTNPKPALRGSFVDLRG